MKKISFTALVSMVLSCVICSIAVNWVALPNGFVVTGITGLAMTAQAFTGVNYALIYYGLMLLILVLTFVMLGYREVSNILFLSFLYPLVLWVLNHWTVEIILKEKLIAAMLFGVIYGVGAGITYRLATPTAALIPWPRSSRPRRLRRWSSSTSCWHWTGSLWL